jgi:hypothetical protein
MSGFSHVVSDVGEVIRRCQQARSFRSGILRRGLGDAPKRCAMEDYFRLAGQKCGDRQRCQGESVDSCVGMLSPHFEFIWRRPARRARGAARGTGVQPVWHRDGNAECELRYTVKDSRVRANEMRKSGDIGASR